MKRMFDSLFTVSFRHQASLALGLMFVSGCVTAKIPSGPDVYAPKTYPNAPKVGVAKCKDGRASEKAGSVGLAGISVKKQDLENLVTSYILDCLNDRLEVNVERVNAETPEAAKTLAGSLGVQAVLFIRITKLEIDSADAAMDAARVVLDGEVWLHNRAGKLVFHDVITGKYSEWIGFKVVDKATGRLVDTTARIFAHELGNRLHSGGLLKRLQ